MASIKKLWPFRNASNFVLTVLGISGVGLVGISIIKQSKFSNPVIGQSIKILGTTQKIKQTLGYPLTYKASFANDYEMNNDEQYYGFSVKGVFGSADVQLTTNCLPVSKIVNHDSEMQDISKKNQQISILANRINQIKGRQKKEKDKNLKAELNIEVKDIEQKIKNKENEIEAIRRSIDDKVQKYYIPEKDYFLSIMNNKIQEKPLPGDVVLHGISNLALKLPNKTRISVIPGQEQLRKPKQKAQLKKQIYPDDIRAKMKEKVDDLSEKELVEYSRHKTSYMYQKYGTYRFISAMIIGIGLAAGISYAYRNRLKSVVGSLLMHNCKNMFLSNPKIINLKKMNKELQKISWTSEISGGLRNKELNCIIDINGVPKGKVYLVGSVEDNKSHEIKFDKFIFEYLHKGKSEKIDLLS